MLSSQADARSSVSWFFTGMRGITSLPALILMTSFVGFSAFALESGITRSQAVFMTLAVWALPAKMILIGTMVGGAPIAASFLAVTLSSIRMMPMVASIMPDMKNEKSPTWLLLFLSHFVAITSWVFAIQHLNNVPRDKRVAYFAGFSITLTLINAVIVGVCYGIVAQFPPIVAGCLFMLTPVYFFASIWASARHSVVKLAFVIGVVMGPAMALIEPKFDIIYAGIGGGTVAYVIDRFFVRPRRAVPRAAGLEEGP
ncbi:putative branched-subunit amino acid permease [Neorhizobium galegae]|uniref:AzlC family ABC transporter permease n=1 Tax=Neorhizobium galegae TaxID=399 RepID=UPI001AE51C36|nr:AzlC family ABC transporter permease [Neorhizobium galegae]MBP2549626.1 putative branched-subunit amino acid permease [Neorhizobium galegae]